MHDDSPAQAPEAHTVELARAATKRSDRYRERFRTAQAVAAQVASSRAAGGAPSDADAARLVAEYRARGGQVTVCLSADDAPSDDKGASGKRA